MAEQFFCANCAHCLVVPQYENERERYILRVKCAKKKWEKRSGEEKLYKYFTVARRVMAHCDEYTPMGDALPYIKNLRKELPIKDEIYTVKEYTG